MGRTNGQLNHTTIVRAAEMLILASRRRRKIIMRSSSRRLRRHDSDNDHHDDDYSSLAQSKKEDCGKHCGHDADDDDENRYQGVQGKHGEEGIGRPISMNAGCAFAKAIPPPLLRLLNKYGIIHTVFDHSSM